MKGAVIEANYTHRLGRICMIRSLYIHTINSAQAYVYFDIQRGKIDLRLDSEHYKHFV